MGMILGLLYGHGQHGMAVDEQQLRALPQRPRRDRAGGVRPVEEDAHVGSVIQVV